MTDCLIVGFNDWDFARYVDMVAAMGRHSGAYRDLALAFVELDGRPARALDVMTACRPGEPPFHNTDFLWPTIPVLGSYLACRGFTFDYVSQFQAERERLRDRLRRGDVRSVAITTTLYVIPEPIVEIVEFVRACDPRVTVIVGGPYIRNQTTSADPDAARRTFRYLGADVYVDSGEGEAALAHVLAALRDGRSLDGIANVAFRRGDDYVVNPQATEANDLGANPVDYTLFPPGDLGQFVSLRTAKSCPFACAFCGFPQRAGRYTYLPVERVERELDAVEARGTVTTVTFLDDTFNVPKRRFQEILRMMIRRRYPFRWNCFYRSDHGDADTIALMGEAGCEGVFLGVESGSAAMLERMNKTARPDDYLAAIPRLARAGISTYASLIVGYPGETFATVRETMAFLESARPDFFRAQLWYADHQTPVWKERERWRIEGEGFNWRHATMDSTTASDLVEEMFLGVEGSLWMPQYGFEQWSTFYLQRRGLSVERIRHFVRCFNEVIKARLLHPERPGEDPALIARLRRSGAPDAEDGLPTPLATPLPIADVEERYPAGAYVAAQRYWTDRFRVPCEPALAPLTDGALAGGRAVGRPVWNDTPVEIEPSALEAVARAGGQDGTGTASTAFACLLSRVSGREEVALVERTATGLVPRRVSTPWDAGFAECAAVAAAEKERARPHEEYAWPILANPVRMREAGAACPSFEAGVEDVTSAVDPAPAAGGNDGRLRDAGAALGAGVGGGASTDPGRAPDDAADEGRSPVTGMAPWPETVRLVLRGGRRAGGPWLVLRHDARRYQAATVRELAACLAALLRAVAADVHAPIGTLALGPAPAPVPATAGDAGAGFDFEA